MQISALPGQCWEGTRHRGQKITLPKVFKGTTAMPPHTITIRFCVDLESQKIRMAKTTKLLWIRPWYNSAHLYRALRKKEWTIVSPGRKERVCLLSLGQGGGFSAEAGRSFKWLKRWMHRRERDHLFWPPNLHSLALLHVAVMAEYGKRLRQNPETSEIGAKYPVIFIFTFFSNSPIEFLAIALVHPGFSTSVSAGLY